MVIAQWFLLGLSVLFFILCMVCVYLYLKMVKTRVEAQIAKEKYLEELERQKREYEEKGVNTFRAGDLD